MLALEASFAENRGELSAEAKERLEQSLGVLDHAIEATEQALAKDPDSAELRSQLWDEYQQKIDALAAVVDLGREDVMNRRTACGGSRVGSAGRSLPAVFAPRHAWAEAPSDGTVNETRPAKPNGVVDIEVPNGSIKIVAWNKAEVNVTGQLDRAELEVTTSSDRTRVRVFGKRHRGEADIEVRVPQGSRIEAKGVDTTLEVRDVTGALRLQSVSGDITVSGSPSDVNANSVNGQVELNVKSGVVNARSISGGRSRYGGPRPGGYRLGERRLCARRGRLHRGRDACGLR